ncbi:MAG: hypothetical protein IPH35_27075 [Rhodoferax sp.]|nr:hypothetical protein [Rhodoferax sp.]
MECYLCQVRGSLQAMFQAHFGVHQQVYGTCSTFAGGLQHLYRQIGKGPKPNIPPGTVRFRLPRRRWSSALKDFSAPRTTTMAHCPATPPITEAEAQQWLRRDMEGAARDVKLRVKVALRNCAALWQPACNRLRDTPIQNQIQSLLIQELLPLIP